MTVWESVCISTLYLFGIAKCGDSFFEASETFPFFPGGFESLFLRDFSDSILRSFVDVSLVIFSCDSAVSLTSARRKQAIFQLGVSNKHMTWTLLGMENTGFAVLDPLCCRDKYRIEMN